MLKITLYLIFFLILSVHVATAQNKSWTFQVKTGMQVSNHFYKDLLVEITPDGSGYTGGIMTAGRHSYRFGLSFGGYATFTPPSWKYISFVGGISYRQRGFMKKVLESNVVTNTNNRLDYLSVDLGVKFSLKKFYWTTGMRYDNLIGKNTSSYFNFYMNDFKGTEFSPFFIQGFNFNISKKYTTAIELEVNPGITKLNLNDKNFPVIPERATNRLTNFAMSLNLVVGLKK